MPILAGPTQNDHGSLVQCIVEGLCPLPTRAEAVALSDQIAIGAGSKSGAEQAKANSTAAAVRRRSWRTYHVVADARESIEQYKQAARSPDPKMACEATLAGLILQSEVEGDLTQASASSYAAFRKDPHGPCAGAFDAIVNDLGAYRPSPTKLAEIDASLRATLAQPSDAGIGRNALEGPVITPADGAKLGPSRIEKIEAFGARDAARIVIHLSSPAMFQVGHIASTAPGSGSRLYIDLARTSRGKAPLSTAVGGLVERVRLGAHDGSTRVVLDMTGPGWRRVFFLPEPFRIIADLTTRAPTGEGPSSAPNAPPGSMRVNRVVIDPGHGGNDPGAIGPGGLKEKDVTLDIAHRLAPILARELGIVTMITRDDDRYVPLEERAARANAFHADVFLSIHCNASESSGSRGIQSYVLDANRDESAARVAARENAASAAAAAQLGSVVTDLQMGHLSSQSTRLANLLQKATISSLHERWADTPNGGVKSAGFYVLLGAEMPSVLFEVSFISNPVEESRLQTADYRQKIADGISNAVRAYREGR